MSWNLQQINGGTGPAVPNEYVACPQAPAADGNSLFVCTFGNQQHFAYSDGNGSLQDCWYDGHTGNWNLQQINGGRGPAVPNEYVACPQAPAAFITDMFVSTFRDQQHFTYVEDYGNLQDCWYDGHTGDWNLQQINGGTGPAVPNEYVASPQAPAAAIFIMFVCTSGNQQHFTYPAYSADGNFNMQDCWYDGRTGNWNLQQINGGTGPAVPNEYVACPQAPAPPAVVTNPGISRWPFVCTFGDQQHFIYFDGHNNLQDCWWG